MCWCPDVLSTNSSVHRRPCTKEKKFGDLSGNHGGETRQMHHSVAVRRFSHLFKLKIMFLLVSFQWLRTWLSAKRCVTDADVLFIHQRSRSNSIDCVRLAKTMLKMRPNSGWAFALSPLSTFKAMNFSARGRSFGVVFSVFLQIEFKRMTMNILTANPSAATTKTFDKEKEEEERKKRTLRTNRI